jgi:hypothetical protein
MTISTAAQTHAQALLRADELAAWAEYLDATRCVDARYGEVEPWAWNRLQRRLRAVQARRARAA